MAAKQLKLWFDKELAKMLAKKIETVHSDFPSRKFIKNVDKGVAPFELKDRIEFISDELFRCLNLPYEKTISILMKIMGPENEEETGMFKEFYWIMPIAKLIEKYGLDDFKLSIKAIEEITKRNTGEFTICLLYTSPSPRDATLSRMPSSA